MSPDSPTQHNSVTVWNPSYGTDVMESDIMLLRERARRFRVRELEALRALRDRKP